MVGEYADRSAESIDIFQDRVTPTAILPADQLLTKHPQMDLCPRQVFDDVAGLFDGPRHPPGDCGFDFRYGDSGRPPGKPSYQHRIRVLGAVLCAEVVGAA